ncbi:MAG: DUF1249 domain-containing protein [Alteromonadaceae bacterium]|nr:DUF1249 domain-containing protein [Alteromonadaceae bacterium]
MNSAKKYRPNLVELMNLSEVNYMLLMRLMRKKVGLRIIDDKKTQADEEMVGDQRHFFISELLAYTITVNEVTRYTSVVTMKQNTVLQETTAKESVAKENIAEEGKEQSDNVLGNKLLSLFKPVMMIRLYHDARMVEIISSQNVRQVKPRYDYPIEAMFHQDEKRQLSQFLKEWLHLCLQQGQVKISLKPSL